MKVLTKPVDLGEGKTVTVRELTVGEIRAWLAEAEQASEAGVDVIGGLLLADCALDDVARMSDLSVDEMDSLAPSALGKIKEAAMALNTDFFGLRQRITEAARALATATEAAGEAMKPD